MATPNIIHNCPKCGTKCQAYTITGRSWYIECNNPTCNRYKRTEELGKWLAMTDEEAAAQEPSQTHSPELDARIQALLNQFKSEE